MTETHEEGLAQVAAANAAGSLVDWTLVHTACPGCGQEWVVEVAQKYVLAEAGTFSLAGVGVKAPARLSWVYRCKNCGQQGSAAPK